ncbi:hypothetical protein SGRA_3486 [Saprospira grandis str. Lewin]|uniref:Uncharacterized protein n=1 Tax=Saprospira grandis (strain Lewin) TaxID=984262 RepID=H6L046_SAPGL|nr:hypothetical protein SGRA_3486 [Saprospira grandis str. Lewin]
MNNSVFYLSPRLYWFDKIVIPLFGAAHSLRSGRAVSQLAGLLGPSFFSLRSKNSVWPSATAIHPSACGGFAACPTQNRLPQDTAKIGYLFNGRTIYWLEHCFLDFYHKFNFF